MAEELGDSSASRKKKRRASSTHPDHRAAEREALWEASALSPTNSMPEAGLSQGARAALEEVFGPEKTRLGRVAERSARYGPDAETAQDAGEGLEALAARYGMTTETLAARLNLTMEVVRAPFADCPPALLAEVARAVRAPLAEVALALGASGDDVTEPQQKRSFADLITMAPSLSEEQRRHWLALLAAGPA